MVVQMKSQNGGCWGGSLEFIEELLGFFEDSLRIRQGFIAVVVISWHFWAKTVCLYFKHDGF
jgi:hypothetical protein